MDVTVRTILQRTAIRFGNTSALVLETTLSFLHKFFTSREVDLIVFKCTLKKLADFRR